MVLELSRNAREVLRELYGRGIYVQESALHYIHFARKGEDTLRDADTVVIATNHPEFKNLGLERLGELVRRRVIVDGRRVVEPHRAAERGFKYYGVGYGRAFRV